MESEATRRIRELEASDADFSDWVIEMEQELAEPTYKARSGKTYKNNPAKGDGYWCPNHTDGCYRRCEDRRWGKFGAAGILFYHRATGTFLLNQRSKAIHHGETWSTLGGAIDKNETPFAGALREAIEEIGNAPESLQVRVTHEDVTEGDTTDWLYTTFVVEVDEQFQPTKTDWESKDNAWVTLQEMVTLPLHPGFKATISDLLTEMYNEGMLR